MIVVMGGKPHLSLVEKRCSMFQVKINLSLSRDLAYSATLMPRVLGNSGVSRKRKYAAAHPWSAGNCGVRSFAFTRSLARACPKHELAIPVAMTEQQSLVYVKTAGQIHLGME